MLPHLAIHDLVLGSASPRRKALLKDAGFEFDTIIADIEEHFSEDLKAQEIPLYLSKLKADHLIKSLGINQILITADTIVWLDNKALNKPSDYKDACRMLNELSGKQHEVFTGVSITSHKKQVSFYVCTTVYFKTLTETLNDESAPIVSGCSSPKNLSLNNSYQVAFFSNHRL